VFRSRILAAVLAASVALSPLAAAAAPFGKPKPAPAASPTEGLERLDGLLSVFVDRKANKVLLRLPAADAEGLHGRFLYQTYLRAGMGSNPVGLDRSAPGDTQVLVFRRVGGKVVVQFENYGFVATRGSPDEKAAVRESFAVSTVWSTDVVSREAYGAVLIDLSGFLTRDAQGIARTLKMTDQGDFRLAGDLSFPDTGKDAINVFPMNIELEATQTFVGDNPGAEVRGILPDPRNITLTLHHSFIALPEPGFEVRFNDPRVGVIDHGVVDYSAPLDEPMVLRLAHRFRLEKTDPSAARSRVKRPIIFYIDRAAPEPVRSALKEGAEWWAQAFEAAGYIDAFRVEILPEGVSPLDARYSVVNWVHRQTRGWSYGHAVVDPRTGEIIKGDVLLGSQRIRQDRIIFEGLLGADATGKGGPNDPIQIALARLRQLSTHEIGHSLGLQHNFAASTYGDRASVMDYPAPRIAIKDGQLDFSDAYGVGAGSWDKFAITWLYGSVPAGEAGRQALTEMATKARAEGLRYVADEDARSADTAHPLGAVWDNGSDPVAELNHLMEVRRIALARFGLASLPKDASTADLKRRLAPIYLFHRYQIDATAKLVGGVDFSYPAKGDGREAAVAVPAARQRQAIDALLAVVAPAALDLNDPLLDLLNAGQSQGYDKQDAVEVFSEGPVFSLPDAADVIAGIVFKDLFAPARLNRMAEGKRRDAGQPGVDELLAKALAAVSAPASGRQSELARRVRYRLIVTLADVQRDKELSPSVAPLIRAALVDYGRKLGASTPADAADRAQARDLAAILTDPDAARLTGLADKAKVAPRLPPGPPIGEDDWFGELGL
jgi:hypothetical protein